MNVKEEGFRFELDSSAPRHCTAHAVQLVSTAARSQGRALKR
jgi:hypothetical protein